RRGRQSAAVRIWRGDRSESPERVDVVVDLRVDDAPRPVHALADLLPKLWLEYGTADPARAVPLTGPTLERVIDGLAANGFAAVRADNVDSILATWASELNLESRLLPGLIDPTVFD